MKPNRNIEDLKEPFKTKVKLMLNEVWEKIFITEWLRNQKRQDELYEQWRTTPWKIVTWTRTSNHKKWKAIDIAFNWWTLYPKRIYKWRAIAKIANKYWIDWSYDLWRKEKAHFQDNNKPLIKNNMFWPNKTINWLTFPSTIYWVEIKLQEWFDRLGMLKLKWANTKSNTYIILSDFTIKKGIDKVTKVLLHEFSHIIYHTILKTEIFEKIDKTDFELTKYEYWDYISRNLKNYITKYASTHSAEDFAELIGYGHYIENKLPLPTKAKLTEDVKFKYIIAQNLYKRGLGIYLKRL